MAVKKHKGKNHYGLYLKIYVKIRGKISEVERNCIQSEILFGSICEALLSLFIPVSFAFINFIGVPFMANKK
jgi:hypothetical protein